MGLFNWASWGFAQILAESYANPTNRGLVNQSLLSSFMNTTMAMLWPIGQNVKLPYRLWLIKYDGWIHIPSSIPIYQDKGLLYCVNPTHRQIFDLCLPGDSKTWQREDGGIQVILLMTSCIMAIWTPQKLLRIQIQTWPMVMWSYSSPNL